MKAKSRIHAPNKGKTLVHYVGGSRYQGRQELATNRLKTALALLSFFTLGISFYTYGHVDTELISPVPEGSLAVFASETTVVIDKNQNADTFIGEAVDEFIEKRYRSEARMIMHCLAHRENGHGGNPDAHGDNGLAGGPFQFHEETWNRMRKQMGATGSNRYDFKEAARTTAWALANGRAKEWGPILRASKGVDHATCPVPTWYR